jgi:hypothetical protein
MTDLGFSDHAVVRMAQRAILPNDVDLILAIGTEVEDGVFVRRKDVQLFEHAVRGILKRLKKLEGKRLVVTNGCLVTAFHACPREQHRLMRRNS